MVYASSWWSAADAEEKRMQRVAALQSHEAAAGSTSEDGLAVVAAMPTDPTRSTAVVILGEALKAAEAQLVAAEVAVADRSARSRKESSPRRDWNQGTTRSARPSAS